MQVGHQAGRGSGGASRKPRQLFMFCIRQVTSVAAVTQMVMCFRERPARDAQETAELRRLEASEPFGDIACRGARRLSDLIAEFQIAGERSAISYCEHCLLQFIRKLPTNQFFVAFGACHGKSLGMA
jgi:hypothetical protein